MEEILQDVSKLFTGDFEDNNRYNGLQVSLPMNSSPFVNSLISARDGMVGKHRGVREVSPNFLFNPNAFKTHNPNPVISTLMENEGSGGKEEDICGRPLQSMTHEEWKIINRVVEGVELQEIPRSDYKGTNRGKLKKGVRELRGLQSSINYGSKSRKAREPKIVK